MSCVFDKDLILEYAIGEVTPDERQQVESHLTACTACRMEVATQRQMVRELVKLPEPAFPSDLEDVLVRASLQAFKTERASRPGQAIAPRRGLYWAFGLGGLLGFGVLVLLVLLLWPGRVSSWVPLGRALDGGVGQGLGLLDSVMQWVADLRAGWGILREFAQLLSPVQRAMKVALAGVGGPIWASLVLGVLGATILLWRVTSAGQKKMRSMGHAKQQG
jgi:hypothetical protein